MSPPQPNRMIFHYPKQRLKYSINGDDPGDRAGFVWATVVQPLLEREEAYRAPVIVVVVVAVVVAAVLTREFTSLARQGV